MKTAREKAELYLKTNFIEWDKHQLKHLERLLKEQDRDTRHACADAVTNIETVDKAYNACMNVKAV